MHKVKAMKQYHGAMPNRTVIHAAKQRAVPQKTQYCYAQSNRKHCVRQMAHQLTRQRRIFIMMVMVVRVAMRILRVIIVINIHFQKPLLFTLIY
jgi:hypothetical protein